VKTTTTTTTTGTSSSVKFFPGTNLKFYPGFVISGTGENAPLSVIQSKWDAIFTSDLNRKETYRPSGVYGGVARRLGWYRFYKDENVRPQNPQNPNDPAYDWSLLDSVFTIDAVKKDGALVAIDIQETNSDAVPNWLSKAPYNGTFLSNFNERQPRYDRYAGPDYAGRTNVGVQPPIVEEWAYFNQAMRDHLIATGNIDKIMGVSGGELAGSAATDTTGFNMNDWYKGTGLRHKLAYDIWASSGVVYYMLTMTDGNKKNQTWPYMLSRQAGMAMPDMKLTSTGSDGITGYSRFTDPNGVYQKDIRPLRQNTEANGLRDTTTFVAGVPNPWGYSATTTKQTASQILWALSGSPKAADPAKRDSKLGQVGEDPPGIMPVHQIWLSFDGSGPTANYPTAADWRKAIDTFGPPGTFAFPYFPAGYNP
jgi:hypothetical protein